MRSLLKFVLVLLVSIILIDVVVKSDRVGFYRNQKVIKCFGYTVGGITCPQNLIDAEKRVKSRK